MDELREPIEIKAANLNLASARLDAIENSMERALGGDEIAIRTYHLDVVKLAFWAILQAHRHRSFKHEYESQHPGVRLHDEDVEIFARIYSD